MVARFLVILHAEYEIDSISNFTKSRFLYRMVTMEYPYYKTWLLKKHLFWKTNMYISISYNHMN